jgi:ABC-type multidrug transport system fused ATPase/permease subunit
MNKLISVLSSLNNKLKAKYKTLFASLAVLSGIAAADYLFSKYFSVLTLFVESAFANLGPVLAQPTVISFFSGIIVVFVLGIFLLIIQKIIKRIVRDEIQSSILHLREATISHVRSLSDEVDGRYFLTGDTCLVSGLYRSSLGKENIEKYFRKGDIFPEDENGEGLTAIWELTD